MDEPIASATSANERAGKRETRESESRSLGKHTWLIVAAIIGAGLMAAFVPGIMDQKREYERTYPGCWQLIGRDQQCEMRTNLDAFLRGR